MAPIAVIDKLIDGRYRVVSLIGEGGMGAVYRATDEQSQQQVALKVINDEEVAQDEVLVARFEREARAAAKVRSPHIVEALGAGHDADTGHPYMVMEVLEGENASQLSRRLGPLPSDLVVRIAAQTCVGLAAAHSQGVVHRDIKPANLFLTRAGGDERIVKLLDFGVAKFKMDQASASDNQSLTRTGSMLGSPMYMSPEQARGLKSIDRRADIWSLGIVMYELLTGRSPHADIDGLGELIITICTEPPVRVSGPAPWVDGPLADVVAHALQLVTADRYQSAELMGKALAALLPDASDQRIDESMLVQLDQATRQAAAGGDAAAGDEAAAFGDTVLLDEEQPADQGAGPPSVSDAAKTLVMDREADEPTVPRPATGGADDVALAQHRQAVLDAARLEPADGASSDKGGRWALAAVALVLVGVAAVAYGLVGRGGALASAGDSSAATGTPATTSSPGAGAAAPTHATAPSSSAPPSSVPPSSASAGPAAPSGPPRLAIDPPTAGVAIAGRRATVKDGYVQLDAPVGKTILVTVTAKGKSTTVAVKMTEHGPVPDRVSAPMR